MTNILWLNVSILVVCLSIIGLLLLGAFEKKMWWNKKGVVLAITLLIGLIGLFLYM